MTSYTFTAFDDRAACRIAAVSRVPSETTALFRTTQASEDGQVYRVVAIDADHVEALNDARQTGSVDPVEAYAATFAIPGESLVAVH
jgi:hypothetical protein